MKILVYFFSILLIFIITISLLIGEDKAWVDCSNEEDLYRYVNEGWKVDKVVKNGDVVLNKNGIKYFHKNEYPRIWLSKGNKVKALNFGWRCYFLEGPELNFTKTNYQTYSAEKYGDVIAKYEIENGEYVITQEVTYQELWKIDPNTREKKSIKKAFSIEKFAQHCEMIRENPLFFATVKEYYFSGGWAEPRHLTIFDLDGNKLGIAPNWEYAEQFCDFY